VNAELGANVLRFRSIVHNFRFAVRAVNDVQVGGDQGRGERLFENRYLVLHLDYLDSDQTTIQRLAGLLLLTAPEQPVPAPLHYELFWRESMIEVSCDYDLNRGRLLGE
jgi:hypothetical protein